MKWTLVLILLGLFSLAFGQHHFHHRDNPNDERETNPCPNSAINEEGTFNPLSFAGEIDSTIQGSNPSDFKESNSPFLKLKNNNLRGD